LEMFFEVTSAILVDKRGKIDVVDCDVNTTSGNY